MRAAYRHPARSAERQASAGARDGVKGKGGTLGARAPLHALVGRHRVEDAACKERETQGKESGQGRDWRGMGDRKGEQERRSRSKSTGGEEQREREGVIGGGGERRRRKEDTRRTSEGGG